MAISQRFPQAAMNPATVEDACRAFNALQTSTEMTIPVFASLPATGRVGQVLMVQSGSASGVTYVWDSISWRQLTYL